MRIDCSEIKTFKECKRKHFYSSRNRCHIVPKKPADNLVFGTTWHNCLHELYLTARDKGTEATAAKLDEIITRQPCVQAGIPELTRTLDNMLKGYYEGPFLEDIAKYKVVDIERGFNITVVEAYTSIEICGSIDMICIDESKGTLIGFEHKSAKNFRPDVYDALDEQPRLYYWALKHIWNDSIALQELAPNGVECIVLNQVKKLVTKFDYKRVICSYSDEELDAFMSKFISDALKVDSEFDATPEPGYMKCQMCDYAPLCIKYGYAEPKDVNDIIATKDADGAELFEIRQTDHLDEKNETFHNQEG